MVGKPPDAAVRRRRRFQTYLEPDLAAAVERSAQADGRQVSRQISWLLQLGLQAAERSCRGTHQPTNGVSPP